MTVPITKCQTPIESFIKGFSRYKNQNVIYWSEKNFLTFDTYIRKSYHATGRERVMLITKGVEYRPDLVAYDHLGMPDAWWKILEVNQMKDIWEFKAGRTIIIPDTIL